MDEDKKPEFYLIAKSKGQKVPDFPKVKVKNLNKPSTGSNQKIEIPIAQNESIDIPELTKEQKADKIRELESQIKKIEKESLPAGMLPKAHILNKEMRIDEIKEQIQNL